MSKAGNRCPRSQLSAPALRAAAMSAIRAGFTPWCADLFADRDLQAVASAAIRCPLDRYPAGFLDVLKSAPNSPWIYTGGLENHPDLIGAMAEIRPLWGNEPQALVQSRSPFAIEHCLRDAGLPALQVRSAEPHLPADCRWLRKPLAGCAGQGIAFAETAGERPSNCHYLQQYVDGTPMSAVFARVYGCVSLLGISEQLIGVAWLNAPPFRYSGNIGPIKLPVLAKNTVERIGEAIGAACNLRGLYGIDFVLERDTPWVVEVNPRYSASIEILEQATGMRALSLHQAAFESHVQPNEPDKNTDSVCGKAIAYAAHRTIVSEAICRMEAGEYADIPSPGEVIEPGWPVLTAMATAPSRDECFMLLRQRVAAAFAILDGT